MHSMRANVRSMLMPILGWDLPLYAAGTTEPETGKRYRRILMPPRRQVRKRTCSLFKIEQTHRAESTNLVGARPTP
jgi:hypothetical protein